MCLAVPMMITEITGPDTAQVEAGGVSTEVSLQLVDDVSVGDYVLIHAGFAIQALDVHAAEETLGLLAEISRAAEEELRGRETSS